MAHNPPRGQRTNQRGPTRKPLRPTCWLSVSARALNELGSREVVVDTCTWASTRNASHLSRVGTTDDVQFVF